MVVRLWTKAGKEYVGVVDAAMPLFPEQVARMCNPMASGMIEHTAHVHTRSMRPV
jgi:hypothetical protein